MRWFKIIESRNDKMNCLRSTLLGSIFGVDMSTDSNSYFVLHLKSVHPAGLFVFPNRWKKKLLLTTSISFNFISYQSGIFLALAQQHGSDGWVKERDGSFIEKSIWFFLFQNSTYFIIRIYPFAFPFDRFLLRNASSLTANWERQKKW